jgi:hypothetical protein
MDCLAKHIPPSLLSLLGAYAPPGSAEYAPIFRVALASLVAVYVGYLYIQSRKEAAVAFNVPVPPEVRKSGTGKSWDEAQGQQKKVLEDQTRGVSYSCFLVFSALGSRAWANRWSLTEMEPSIDYELLSCRWESAR